MYVQTSSDVNNKRLYYFLYSNEILSSPRTFLVKVIKKLQHIGKICSLFVLFMVSWYEVIFPMYLRIISQHQKAIPIRECTLWIYLFQYIALYILLSWAWNHTSSQTAKKYLYKISLNGNENHHLLHNAVICVFTLNTLILRFVREIYATEFESTLRNFRYRSFICTWKINEISLH